MKRSKLNWLGEHIPALVACASTDETRYTLNGIHIDGEWAISTDGHRLYGAKVSTLNQSLKWTHEKTYECKALVNAELLKEIEGKYPNWRQLVPNPKTYSHGFKVTIPNWFAAKVPKGKPLYCGIDTNGSWSLSNSSLVHFNASLFAPLVERGVDFYLKDSLSPVLMLPSGATTLESSDWFMIVMPMKRGTETVKVIRTPGGEI